MVSFISDMFPKAKFLHILRHPFEVVQSSLKFGNGTGGDIWKGLSSSDILAQWEKHENWVKDANKEHNLDLLEVKYSNLISNPSAIMKDVFNFLGVKTNKKTLQACYDITFPNFKKINQYKLSDSQKKIMVEHSFNYSLSFLESTLKPIFKNLFYRFLRKMKSLKKLK